MKKPFLRVSCAIIERDGLVLATRRAGGGAMAGKWEFPGGKIERNETPEQCVLREIKEELGRRVRIREALPPSPHGYPDFDIILHPFVCSLDSAEAGIDLRDHSEAAWKTPGELRGLDWAEADVPVLAAYIAFRGKNGAGEART